MIEVSKRFHPPTRPWGSMLLLVFFGLLGLLVVASVLFGAWKISPQALYWLRLATLRIRFEGVSVVVLAAVLLTLAATVLALRVGLISLHLELARNAAQALRDYRLLSLLDEHRGVLPAYFPGREGPAQVVEVDTPDSRAPPRTLDLLLTVTAAALVLDLLAVWAHDLVIPEHGPLMARTSTLAFTGLTLALLSLADLDRTRRRLLVAGYVVASGWLMALAPHLLTWAPGLVPMLVVLVVLMAARRFRRRETTWCLFLTNRGVRRLGFLQGEILESTPPSLKPERLILHPGVGECRWELWTAGEPSLEVQPLGGKPHEVAVIGSLNGWPLRITGETEARGRSDRLRHQWKATLALVLFLSLLVAFHWYPLCLEAWTRGLIGPA